MISATPGPPYVAVIFTSQRKPGDEGYGEMSARMAELAARDWKGVMAHREAQALGKARWCEAYAVRIATVGRDYRMEKEA